MYFLKVAHVQYLRVVDIVSYTSKKFLTFCSAVQYSAKIIKIDRDFPKLWSQMYCHFLWFTVYSFLTGWCNIFVMCDSAFGGSML